MVVLMKINNGDFDQKYLQSRLDYDPGIGIFYWRLKAVDDQATRGWNTRWSLKSAGRIIPINGIQYIRIGIDYRPYLAHRLAWLYINGVWPDCDLDHVDGNGLNNKIENIRRATRSQNNMNQKLQKNNTSGVKGVFRCPKSGKYWPQINENGNKHWLGTCDTLEEASERYRLASIKYHGEFRRDTD
jgi:hypothetical protein